MAVAAAGLPLPAPAAAAAAAPAATVVGELVQAYPERADPEPGDGATAPLSWVRTAAGESVRIPTGDVAGVPAGATVSVDVAGQVGDAASGEGYGPVADVVSTDVRTAPPAGTRAPAPAAGLTDQVTVAMVVPPGGTRDAVTLDSLVATVNGPVARFWAGQTGGAVRLGVTAAQGWTATRAGCGDPTALWAEVAGTVGFRPGPGRHLVVYLSSLPGELPGCSYALGQVGSGLGSGGSLYVRDALPAVIAHELGHNFGLGHSSGLQCDGAVDSGVCRTQGYRDYYDVMGASWEQLGVLTAAQADRLGVLPAAQHVDLPSGFPAGTYTLAPLARATGIRALRFSTAAGDYWLEYRAAAGRDAWLGTAANRFGLQTGVLLHRTGPLPDTALLLDGTPSAGAAQAGDLQAALPVGVAVPVDGGEVTVTVGKVTAAGATVTVAPRSPLPAAQTPAAPVAPEALPAPLPVPAGTGSPPAGTGSPEQVAPAPVPGPGPAATGPAAEVTVAAPVGQPTPNRAPSPVLSPVLSPVRSETAAAGERSGMPGIAALGALAGGAGLVATAVASLRRRAARR